MTRFVRFSCLALYLMTAVLVLSACQTYSANGSSTGTDENASSYPDRQLHPAGADGATACRIDRKRVRCFDDPRTATLARRILVL